MELTNNDLVDMVKIIDVCSSRGAFRGEELAAVGTLRNKLANYLNSQVETPAEEAEAIN